MGYPLSQLSIADSLPTIESASFFDNRSKRLDASLLMETILVAAAAILAIRFLLPISISRAAWLVAPGILIAAALIPTAVKNREFAHIGFDLKQIRHTLPVVCLTCAVVFPAMVCGLWLLKYWQLEFPLRVVLPKGQNWICWLFYQFMYVAVAEEVFFRGYVQNNILRLTSKVKRAPCWLQQWTSIGVSAAVFAVAHVIVRGGMISVLTFLPGLICGWLFIRTKSLLAPILLHGLANTCYAITTLLLT